MDFEKLRANRNETNVFLRYTGAQIIKVEDGSAVIELVPSENVLNPGGAVHGGCLYTMMDAACGTAACSDGYHTATISSSVNFMNPAINITKLTAVSRELKRGKKVKFYEAEVRDQDGKIICTGQFSFMRLGMELKL